MIAAEMLRFWSRRLTRWLCIGGVAILALTGFLSFINTDAAAPRQPTEAEIVTSPVYEDCVTSDGFGQFTAGDPEIESFCVAISTDSGFQEDNRAFVVDLKEIFIGTTVPIALLVFFLAASGIGAEWQKGTMTTTLTWETRRGVVFAGKLGASLISGAFIFLGFQGLLTLVLLPSFALHGTTQGVDSEWWRATFEVLVRGGAITLIAAIVGFSLASIGRNTAAAIGIAFGYMLVVETLIRVLKPAWQPWLIGDNLGAFVTDEVGAFSVITHSPEAAGLIVFAYAAAIALAAFAIFKARDVT